MTGLEHCKFYGKGNRRRKKIKVIEEQAGVFEAKPLPSLRLGSLLGPTVEWKVFRQQIDAINFWRSFQEDTMVFSFEHHIPGSSGKRSFVVCHPEEMWYHQQQRSEVDRCNYEVILQDQPCHLYFDLEYCKSVNLNICGVECTEVFINVVCYFLLTVFKVSCSIQDVINLDSSTSGKFSKHLIFRMPDAVFASNVEAGVFVNFMCWCLENWINGFLCDNALYHGFLKKGFSLDQMQSLFFRNTKGCSSFICDRGVYTKNRNFRVFKSTKYGKNAPLTLASDNAFRFDKKDDLEVFLKSLVTRIGRDERGNVLTFNECNAVLSVNLVSKFLHSRNKNSSIGTSSDKTQITSATKSPYPEIDEFVSNLVSCGHIRKWRMFSGSDCISYDIGNFRYCSNIGRQHKSNNILIIVDLRNGVYYQKCYDPECSGYRSPPVSLPGHLLNWTDDSDFPACGVEDEEMIAAAEAVENIDWFEDY